METKKELKTYQWKGKNKLGKEISGENDAKNDAVLKAFLAKQGLVNVTVKEKPKPLEQDEILSSWAEQELQRPIIQRILQKQEENKPFISGTITHIGNDGKETRLGNITIHLKE